MSQRWTIQEVARLAGVTARTLRHYHAIGLLTPAGFGSNGYRFYGRPELLRLQEILLLRELGLDLSTTGAVLDGELDRVAALRGHRTRLIAQRDRLDRLAITVSRTIEELQGGAAMAAEEIFDGFAEQRQQLEEELVQQHGEGVREHFATSDRRTQGWTKQDFGRVQREGEELEGRLLAAMRSGQTVDDERVVALIAEHLAGVRQFWEPDRRSYTGLGVMYVEHPEFRARYDALDPRFAEWLCAAIGSYAATHL